MFTQERGTGITKNGVRTNWILPRDLAERLLKASFERRVSQSALVRKALEQYLRPRGRRKDERTVDAGPGLDPDGGA